MGKLNSFSMLMQKMLSISFTNLDWYLVYESFCKQAMIILNVLSFWPQAGEERFSVEIDENNQVWYEVLSFSKPAHILSFLGYPYVMLRQKHFANESSKAMLKHISSSKS